MADQGAEQCGFCNPGFLMNVFAMLEEIQTPQKEEIGEYLYRQPLPLFRVYGARQGVSWHFLNITRNRGKEAVTDELCKQTGEKKGCHGSCYRQPVYTDDLAPKDCLIVEGAAKPHAHA